MRPAISVISPCYNHGKYIHEMLESVLSQTFEDFEAIVVDDGSTDDTRKILASLKHPKVSVVHYKHRGPSAARNTGIEKARGEIILNLDADDKIAPTFLEKAFSVFSDSPDAGIVYSDVEFFGAKSGKFNLELYSIERMLRGNLIPGNAAFFLKKDWRAVGGFSEELVYGLEDYDFFLSIIASGRKVYKISEPLAYYRQYRFANRCRSGKMQIDRRLLIVAQLAILKRHVDLYADHPDALRSMLDQIYGWSRGEADKKQVFGKLFSYLRYYLRPKP